MIVQILILLVIIALYLVKRKKDNAWMDAIPGPPPHDILAGGFGYFADQTQFRPMLYKMMEDYGEIVLLKPGLLVAPVVLLSNPEACRDLCNKEHGRGWFSANFAMHTGKENLFVSDGIKWRSVRRIAARALGRQFVEQSKDIIAHQMKIHLKILRDRVAGGMTSIEVDHMCADIVLDMFGVTTFGYEFKALENSNGPFQVAMETLLNSGGGYEVVGLMRMTLSRLGVPIDWNIPLFGAPKQKAEFMREAGRKLIRERRKVLEAGDRPADLLTALIESFDMDKDSEDMKWVTDVEESLVSALQIFYVAGHETTGHTLGHTLYLFCKHLEKQDMVREEVMSVMGKDLVPTFEQVDRMPLVKGAVQEAMRLMPVSGGTSRVLENDQTIMGYTVRKGTLILINAAACQVDERYWERPTEFLPERYLKKPFSPDSDAFLSFGAGQRLCVGMRFVYMEMPFIMATLLRNFKFKFTEGKSDVKWFQDLTLKPIDGIWLDFEMLN